MRSLAKMLLMVASGASNGSEVAVRIVHPSKPDEVREVTAASCSGRVLSPKLNHLWLQLFLLFPNKGLGFEVDPGDDIKPWLAAVAANGRLCVSCDARVLSRRDVDSAVRRIASVEGTGVRPHSRHACALQ
jgi:hypothetical protein